MSSAFFIKNSFGKYLSKIIARFYFSKEVVEMLGMFSYHAKNSLVWLRSHNSTASIGLFSCCDHANSLTGAVVPATIYKPHAKGLQFGRLRFFFKWFFR
jgi:hypothetical protein